LGVVGYHWVSLGVVEWHWVLLGGFGVIGGIWESLGGVGCLSAFTRFFLVPVTTCSRSGTPLVNASNLPTCPPPCGCNNIADTLSLRKVSYVFHSCIFQQQASKIVLYCQNPLTFNLLPGMKHMLPTARLLFRGPRFFLRMIQLLACVAQSMLIT